MESIIHRSSSTGLNGLKNSDSGSGEWRGKRKERERLAALYDPKTDVPPDVAKIEFVQSMLDKLIGENGHLQPEDRSLIAASLKNIYKPLIASGYTAPCPTLGDLYRDLNKSNLRRAKQLALMLDVFANGSLQAFSPHHQCGYEQPPDLL